MEFCRGLSQSLANSATKNPGGRIEPADPARHVSQSVLAGLVPVFDFHLGDDVLAVLVVGMHPHRDAHLEAPLQLLLG